MLEYNPYAYEIHEDPYPTYAALRVLIDNGRWRVIRRRQTIDDMLTMESGG